MMMKSGVANSAPLLLLAILDLSSAYRQFQAILPNGGKVPNPCDGKSIWDGLGHQSSLGGSVLNPFGEDFRRLGKSWTRDLCDLDSDGDGRTNGQELGDPNCTWSPGKVTAPAVSHPGICEPVDSEICRRRNQWLKCDGSQTENNEESFLNMCEHIRENSTFSLNITLTPVPVPAEETVYTCQVIDLDLDPVADLHMVATQPIIKAIEVVHHIILFGCDPREELADYLRSPHHCAMAPVYACRSLIGAWTLGSPGDCAHPEMGFRMGFKGYRTVALQVHWNNPKRLSGLTDSSGLKIHLTSDLRPNDAGMLVVGQRFMQIDSGHTQFEAICPSHCTNEMFQTPIFITSAINHMHYLGQHQSIKVYKNNSVHQVITDQDNWSYDDPVIFNFKNAIKVNRGDEIRTTCIYKPPSHPDPVCWGQSTKDEMCFGFLTYYPLQSLERPWCVSMNKFPSCERHLPALASRPFDGCRWWEFRDTIHPETKRITGSIFKHCFPEKNSELVCTEKCRKVAQLVASHPCVKGKAGSYMMDKFKQAGKTGLLFLDAVMTCSCAQFDHCDRKYHGGVLGSKHDVFCPFSTSSSVRPSFGQTSIGLLCLFFIYSVII